MQHIQRFIFGSDTDENVVQRLDLFLVVTLQMSRSQVQKLINDERVYVNGRLPKKAGDQLKTGAVVEIREAVQSKPQETTDIRPTVTDAHIYTEVYVIAEEPEYLVVYKPAGLLIHETDAREPVTLAHWLVEQYPELKSIGEDPRRPGIVHRLDKEASGLLVIARTQNMFNSLKQQFKTRSVEKEYTVLVHGATPKEHDTIDFLIDRGREGRMVARPKLDPLQLKNVEKMQPGKIALTEYDVVKRFPHLTLLSVRIHTGRMHQIRVHLFAYDHPVVGDELYNGKKQNRKLDKKLGRLFLHATRLCFQRLDGERVCYACDLPKELLGFLDNL